MKSLVILSLAMSLLGLPAMAAPSRPFVTVRDDGTIASFSTKTGTPDELTAALVQLYDTSGAPRPDIISVWTSFNFDDNAVETIPLNLENEVRGIGFESLFGGDGTFSSQHPPVKMVLMHNNVLRLTERARFNRAPVNHFAEYLFLLELSHLWGPAVKLPGPSTHALIGFVFHWSFWLDTGGSPAGGNRWHDNGDGTFSTLVQTPRDVRFSMLDLYLMGLASPEEVSPFGILEDPVPPTDETDPMDGKPYEASSFPRFDATPLTVAANWRALTIDDIVTKNGMRQPSRGQSPTSWTLGIVLLVPSTATDDEIAAAQIAFQPIASNLAPAFSTATRNRGALDVITLESTPMDGGNGDGSMMDSSQVVPAGGSGGCSVTDESECDGVNLGIVGIALAFSAVWVRLLRRRVVAERA